MISCCAARLYGDNGFPEIFAGEQLCEGSADSFDTVEAMFWRLNDAFAQPMRELIPCFFIAIMPEMGHEALYR